MDYTILVFIQLLFAINFLTTKVVLGEINPIIFSFYRFSLSAIVLGLYLLIQRQSFRIIDRSIYIKLLLVAFAIPLSQTVFIAGLQLTTATNTSLLSTTIPVFTLFIALLRRQIKGSSGIFIGFLLALSGILIYKDFSKFTFSSSAFKGDLLVLLGCVFFAVSISLSKDVVAKIRPLTATFYVFTFGSCILFPLNFAIFDDPVSFTFLEDTTILYNFLFSVFGGTLLTYFLNNFIIKRLSPDVVSLGIYLQPIFAGFLSWHFLNEDLTLRVFISLGLIFSGVYLITRSHKNEASGKPIDKP